MCRLRPRPYPHRKTVRPHRWRREGLSAGGVYMETNVMRCRHCGAAWDLEYEYCPQCDRNYSGAVYPAQHTAQEIEDAARVAKEIRDAFQSVSLGDGLSLSQADLEGVY